MYEAAAAPPWWLRVFPALMRRKAPQHGPGRAIREAFRLQGYAVREGETHSDFELDRDGERFLVRCSQWREPRVGVVIVREFYGVMSRSGASGGFLITSGRFSDDAVAFAQDTHLQLIDGKELFALLRQAKALQARAR